MAFPTSSGFVSRDAASSNGFGSIAQQQLQHAEEDDNPLGRGLSTRACFAVNDTKRQSSRRRVSAFQSVPASEWTTKFPQALPPPPPPATFVFPTISAQPPPPAPPPLASLDNIIAITHLPEYENQSFEELRLEQRASVATHNNLFPVPTVVVAPPNPPPRNPFFPRPEAIVFHAPPKEPFLIGGVTTSTTTGKPSLFGPPPAVPAATAKPSSSPLFGNGMGPGIATPCFGDHFVYFEDGSFTNTPLEDARAAERAAARAAASAGGFRIGDVFKSSPLTSNPTYLFSAAPQPLPLASASNQPLAQGIDGHPTSPTRLFGSPHTDPFGAGGHGAGQVATTVEGKTSPPPADAKDLALRVAPARSGGREAGSHASAFVRPRHHQQARSSSRPQVPAAVVHGHSPTGKAAEVPVEEVVLIPAAAHREQEDDEKNQLPLDDEQEDQGHGADSLDDYDL